MLFSSITFIYYFLPAVLLIYFLTKDKYKNFVLLIVSLFFYFYGEQKLTILLILVCIVNYIFGLLIEKYKNKKLLFVTGLLFDIGILVYYKYFDFLITNFNQIFQYNIPLLHIVMPLGISFFLFQAISYLADIYQNKVSAEHHLIDLMCYITLFPQLVAGPIVRYKDIKNQLSNKEISYQSFGIGVERFIIGLSKKVILANNLGIFINCLNHSSNFLSSWLVAISFSLQIYFDFSGYSDMAIGLGHMLGFHFPENFNYPFIASSITDFWHRWHMSLSSFFKDYIYIPMGGNRVSKIKWIFNIFVVWMLTGLWHGASWNFVTWGLFFAVILLLEKSIYGKWLSKTKIIKYLYTIIVIIFSFVIFNANNMSEVITSFKNMFNISIFSSGETWYYLRSYFLLLIISIILSTPFIKKIGNVIKNNKGIKILEIIIIFSLFIISTAYLVDASFNPFLYFRF